MSETKSEADADTGKEKTQEQVSAQTNEQATDQTGHENPTGDTDKAAAPTKAAPPKWALDRVDALTRQLRESQEAKAAADRALEEAHRQLREGATGTAQPDQAVIRAEAARIAAEQQFNTRCTEVADAGKAEFKDFTDSIGNFQKLGGLTIPTLHALLEVDDPHKVLYALSHDLDETSRIMNMSPLRQVAALTKYGAKLAQDAAKAKMDETKTTLDAGRPPDAVTDTVSGRGRSNVVRLDDDKLSMRDWMAERQRQLAKKKA